MDIKIRVKGLCCVNEKLEEDKEERENWKGLERKRERETEKEGE